MNLAANRSLKDLKVVMIDNYDSFTFNLVQYLLELGLSVETIRNDKTSVAEVIAMKPDFVVISPGPSIPDKAGICLELVKGCFDTDIPLLGVCLGHQSIGQVFGGKVIKAKLPMHGKVSMINHHGTGVFKGLQNPIATTRYHSLIVERESLPKELKITAESQDGIIMGLRHIDKLIEGVQFHPESVLTESGKEMLSNFATEVIELERGQ